MVTERATGGKWHHLVLNWAGVGSVLGAACWTVTSVLEAAVLGTRPYDATPFDVVELVGWILMVGGLVGLPAALGTGYGRLGRIGHRAAAVGMALVAGLYVRAVLLLMTAGFQLFHHVASAEDTLYVHPASDATFDGPVEPGCWRLTEPVAVPEYYGTIRIPAGETTQAEAYVYGHPGLPEGVCLPEGEHRLETSGVVGDDEDAVTDGNTGSEFDWSFTLQVG